MATYINDRFYRKKSVELERRLRRFEDISKRFPDLRFVPPFLEESKALSGKFQQALIQFLKFRSDELIAEKNLKKPTDELAEVIHEIYSGMIFFGVEDSVVQKIFIKGLPEPKNTNPAELEMILERIFHVFQRDMKGHSIEEVKGAKVERILSERSRWFKAQALAEIEALKARKKVVKCYDEMRHVIRIMAHLVRADNVLNPGVYRVFFPHPKTRKSSAEEK